MTALLYCAFICFFFGCLGVVALYLHVSQATSGQAISVDLAQIEAVGVGAVTADQTARFEAAYIRLGQREREVHRNRQAAQEMLSLLETRSQPVQPVRSGATSRHLWVNKPTYAKKRSDQSRLSHQVREAAGWMCQQCGVVLRGGYSYLLHMHHIDGDHTNNKEENLMALCVECHSQQDGIGHKLLGEEIACDGRLKRLRKLRRAQRGGA